MTRFEYRIVSGSPSAKGFWGRSLDWSSAEKAVNDLVAEGWEVFASHTGTFGSFMLGSGQQAPVLIFVLRRPVPQ
jgi:hypothetical protein